MGVRAVICFELICDGCGVALCVEDEEGDALASSAALDLEEAGRDLGWSTDGRDRWHCTSCDVLVDAAHAPAGQIGLGDEGPDDDEETS